ncbi:MAG: type II toxin-antitoxin system VapB family antitoxin [Egibacteraceae bacterium]
MQEFLSEVRELAAWLTRRPHRQQTELAVPVECVDLILRFTDARGATSETGAMMRPTVNLDDALLRDAQATLKTSGVTATVNAALAAVVRQSRLAAFDVRLFDITDDDISEARRERKPMDTDEVV